MKGSINSGRKTFRYGVKKQPELSASLMRAVERFFTLGLRLAGFLHQFKTPLHVIQSQAELLLEEKTLSPQLRTSLAMIRQNAERLTGQTQSILDLARGKDASPEALPLGNVMETICHAAEVDCRKRNIRLEKNLSATAPIRLEAVALEGAIHNLVNNAVEAMPKGGVLRVKTFESADGRRVGIEIQDSGAGMDRKTLRRVTQTPFQTSKANGTGLGLYISQYILRRHKASIKWESNPGKGTTVTILFPKSLPPRWGKARMGVPAVDVALHVPPPQPSPTRGEGVYEWLRNKFSIGMLALLCVTNGARASHPPQMLRIQGRFTDNQKVPLTDNLPIRFSIWDSPDGYGNLMWQDVQNVTIQSNTFQVVLGRMTPLPPAVFSGGDRWLEMQIANDAPLRPRHRIPYQVIQAQVAAPPPPVDVTPEEKRELEVQIDKYKEEVPVAPPPEPKVEPKPAPKPVPVPKPAVVPAPRRRPRPPVHVIEAEDGGEAKNVYTVQAGETLKSIAQKLYGNAELWYDLYYLNRDRLGPMGHLFTGQILVLPTKTPGDNAR